MESQIDSTKLGANIYFQIQATRESILNGDIRELRKNIETYYQNAECDAALAQELLAIDLGRLDKIEKKEVEIRTLLSKMHDSFASHVHPV